MTQTTLNMDLGPQNIWSELSLGAKLAAGVAAIALIGASLAASLFLAGAALFSGLVMMVYRALARDQGPIEGELDATQPSDESTEG